MTSFTPPSDAQPSAPSVEKLPTYTETPVPGFFTYFVILDGKYRGIYTDWAVVGPAVRLLKASHRKVTSWSAAVEALNNADVAIAMVTNQMASVSINDAAQTSAASQAHVSTGAAATTSSRELPTASMRTPAPAAPAAPPAPPPSRSPSPSSLPTGELVALVATDEEIEEGMEEHVQGRGSRPRNSHGGWPYLAVARGRKRGIFPNTPAAISLTVGYPGQLARGFRTIGGAHLWLEEH
ncbi:hypothetical protein FA95DRAFT_1607657 [Auriscalpium vulgare]|uniref:Uncharacterized protein n=1 Tax=Auriscalpium vulgare TaxID=40419 RepID=A0ACB8RMR3_9AGAM|nr:hypothetical protein FA95DRAFT_1607657 [Auriscalpium vulgare]